MPPVLAEALLVVLAPGSLNHIANTVKGYAIAVGVAFGIAIVWVWYRHAQDAARVARETRAKEAYGQYLAVAMANPALAQPGALGSVTPLQRAQYEWFVGYFLNTAEQVLLYDPSPAWRTVLRQHLMLHQELLASDAFRTGIYRTMSDELRTLIDQASGSARAAA